MTDTQKNRQEHLSLQCELELGKSKAVRKQRVRVWRRGWSAGRPEEALSSLQPERRTAGGVEPLGGGKGGAKLALSSQGSECSE